MHFARLSFVCLVLLLALSAARGRRHERRDSKKRHEASGESQVLPFSQKKFEKMLQKAIFKIIMGELSAADRTLLKSFNYSHADIEAFRDYELSKKKEEAKTAEVLERIQREKEERKMKDLEMFNKKALEDYENLDPVEPSMEEERISEEKTLHQKFDEAMKPHVVFQIRPDDSEFDSISEEISERPKLCKETKVEMPSSTTVPVNKTESFLDSGLPPTSVPIPYLRIAGKDIAEEDINQIPQVEISDGNELQINDTKYDDQKLDEERFNATAEQTEKPRVYKGLEWVHDDVYRVIPEAMETYNFEIEETENYDYDEDQIAYDPSNDTMESSGPVWDMPRDDPASTNLTSYQKLLMAQRRLQGQKAIEDIKLKVLVMTGRFNHTNNQVQKERLTMFLPTCQVPRNTDPEAWSDPFSMNMHFQLNLTANDHIAAARLRLFNLPQENLTSSSSSSFEGEEEDEKKIRISVYFYSKALKKHRTVKKRLMDSVVTSLTSTGNHLALDVRQALRFWRRSSRYPHGNGSNHGLVVQVEDQDGRPLKPAAYIQQPSCEDADSITDQKAYNYVPALYIRACSRYVRVINGETQTYYYCKKS